MSFADVSRIASDFNSLASRFEEFARRATKPQHLLVDVQQTAVRAGRLLQEAATAGVFEGDAWWRDGRSPVHPYDDGAGNYARYNSEEERFGHLWTNAITSWLTKRWPERFRHDAREWDWARVKKDESGRPLGRDGKPLRRQWFRDGVPLPDDFDGNLLDPDFGRSHPPGEYEWRLVELPTYAHESYDAADALAHLRIRAEVYADACRLVAELIARAIEPPLGADPGGQGSIVASGSSPLHRIAAQLEALATQTEPAALVAAAAQAGALLREARAAGALRAIEWPELDCCFRGYDPSNAGTLNAARRLFVCVAERLAKGASSIARQMKFRPQPEHLGRAFDWEWLAETLRALAGVIRAEASMTYNIVGTSEDSAPDTSQQRRPDGSGYVALPLDPTAYVPASEIIAKYSPADSALTQKRLVAILENFKESGVRWSRPLQKNGKPRLNRMIVHLTDWQNYLNRNRGDSDGWPEMSHGEIEQRTSTVRQAKSGRM